MKVEARTPVHMTMRLRPGIRSLRSKSLKRAFDRAAHGAKQFGLRINHFSSQSNHLHMVAEASDNAALGRGMRSFGGSLGRTLRSILGGRGAVFDGRYYLRALRTPIEYTCALRYVLLNHSHHTQGATKVDPFSPGSSFGFWTELAGLKVDIVHNPALAPPRSWLGRVGWLRSS